MRRIGIQWALLLSLVVIAPASARADDSDVRTAADSDRADKLVAEGLALGDAGNWAGAKTKLEEAWALKKSYDIAGNFALVEEQLGNLPESARHYEFALRTFPTSGKPDHKKTLLAGYGDVRAKVGALRIVVTAPKSTLLVDGKPVGESPLEAPVFVVPGGHEVEVRQAGFVSQKRIISVKAGGETVVDVALKPDSTTHPGSSRPVWPAILLGGLGAAGIGVGIAGVVLGAERDSDATELAVSATCQPVTPACLTDGEDLASERDTFNAMGIAGFAAGGAALVGMTVYLLVPEDDASSTEARLMPIPWVDQDFAGISLLGRF